MCLAQGPQRSDAGEARTHCLSVLSQALYHWATALPRKTCVKRPLTKRPKNWFSRPINLSGTPGWTKSKSPKSRYYLEERKNISQKASYHRSTKGTLHLFCWVGCRMANIQNMWLFDRVHIAEFLIVCQMNQIPQMATPYQWKNFKKCLKNWKNYVLASRPCYISTDRKLLSPWLSLPMMPQSSWQVMHAGSGKILIESASNAADYPFILFQW